MPRLTREQSREITREKLRLSAISEISVYGFSGASIDRICESAGYSRGAFYANFASKEALLLDIMRTDHGREAENWIALLESADSVPGVLPVLRNRFAQYLADRNKIMFMTELKLYASRNEQFLKSYAAEFQAVSLKAEQVLHAIYRKANLVPHRPVSVLANMMRGLFSGLILEDKSGHAASEQSAELLVVFVEDLLRLGKPR